MIINAHCLSLGNYYSDDITLAISDELGGYLTRTEWLQFNWDEKKALEWLGR
jgi:hypothetical protein